MAGWGYVARHRRCAYASDVGNGRSGVVLVGVWDERSVRVSGGDVVTDYAIIAGSEVLRVSSGKPRVGLLPDGRTVTFSADVDDTTLARVGWVPVVDVPPTPGPGEVVVRGGGEVRSGRPARVYSVVAATPDIFQVVADLSARGAALEAAQAAPEGGGR